MDYSQLGQAAAESDDLTQEGAGFERELPRAGVAFVRLREYIETGKHDPKAGSTFKPAYKTILVFELSHPDHLIEIDGKKVPQSIFIRLNKGSTNASGYRKLFNVMNQACGGGMNHFVQMIGKPFLGEIFHNPDKNDAKKIYANLDNQGAWSLRAPVQIDVLNNTSTPIPIPELDGKTRAFLWENESVPDASVMAMWEEIYIDGTREVKDKDGQMIEKSKNWIQELIMANNEWEGSKTQGLTQEHVTLDDIALEEPLAAMAGAAGTAPTLDD
jgi:hypothetical protein